MKWNIPTKHGKFDRLLRIVVAIALVIMLASFSAGCYRPNKKSASASDEMNAGEWANYKCEGHRGVAMVDREEYMTTIVVCRDGFATTGPPR